MATGKKRFPIILIACVIVLGCLIFAISRLTLIIVTGLSMEPGLHMGERLLVNKNYYHYAQPKRGELVLMASPLDPKLRLVKRIVALPGEEIEIKDGQLVINGALREWPAPLKEAPVQDFEKQVMPKDAVFVLGDNVNNSFDSRSFGPVIVSKLLGKAIYIF